jgi:predicted enzyme related to lactoylglutathione lyase
MSILGLRTCIYRVSDLPKAIVWYAEWLGVQPYFNEPYYVGFNVGGYELGLQPIESESFAVGNNIETYWGVNDVPVAFAALTGHGAKSIMPPTEVGGGIMVATAEDPWGNLIGLIYNPHFTLTAK